MAKRHSFGVKDVVGEVKEGGGGGRVPPPPAGAYRGVLIQMKLEENKNGEPMLNTIVQLKMPPKLKKHDGYWVWTRFNLTDQGAPYLNGFLNALAGDEKKGLLLQKELWEKGTLTTVDEDGGDVTKIGSFIIGSPEGKKPIAVAVIERSYINKNDEEVETVEATRWMPAQASLSEGNDDDADDLSGDGLDDDLADDGLGDEAGDADGDADGLDDDLDGGGDSADSGSAEAGDDDPEADEFNTELDAIADLKEARLKARDEFDIAAADTKGKTLDEVKDMIFDAWDAKRGDAEAEPEADDLDDDLDEKPAAKPATRRGSKAKAGGEPPF